MGGAYPTRDQSPVRKPSRAGRERGDGRPSAGLRLVLESSRFGSDTRGRLFPGEHVVSPAFPTGLQPSRRRRKVPMSRNRLQSNRAILATSLATVLGLTHLAGCGSTIAHYQARVPAELDVGDIERVAVADYDGLYQTGRVFRQSSRKESSRTATSRCSSAKLQALLDEREFSHSDRGDGARDDAATALRWAADTAPAAAVARRRRPPPLPFQRLPPRWHLEAFAGRAVGEAPHAADGVEGRRVDAPTLVDEPIVDVDPHDFAKHEIAARRRPGIRADDLGRPALERDGRLEDARRRHDGGRNRGQPREIELALVGRKGFAGRRRRPHDRGGHRADDELARAALGDGLGVSQGVLFGPVTLVRRAEGQDRRIGTDPGEE